MGAYKAKRNVPMQAGIWYQGEVRVLDTAALVAQFQPHIDRGVLVEVPAGNPLTDDWLDAVPDGSGYQLPPYDPDNPGPHWAPGTGQAMVEVEGIDHPANLDA